MNVRIKRKNIRTAIENWAVIADDAKVGDTVKLPRVTDGTLVSVDIEAELTKQRFVKSKDGKRLEFWEVRLVEDESINWTDAWSGSKVTDDFEELTHLVTLFTRQELKDMAYRRARQVWEMLHGDFSFAPVRNMNQIYKDRQNEPEDDYDPFKEETTNGD